MADKLNPDEVGCSICLDILTEPITMPCNHRMCKPCFEKNLELANMQCPFCKKRIGTWCRKAKKIETLIDQNLWKKIREQYPDLVSARQRGESNLESSGLFDSSWSHDICENGVIGKEYEKQLEEIRRENEEKAKAEEELSKKLIEELMKEEKAALPKPEPIITRQAIQKAKPNSVRQFFSPAQPETPVASSSKKMSISGGKSCSSSGRKVSTPKGSSSSPMRHFLRPIKFSMDANDTSSTETSSSQPSQTSSKTKSPARSSEKYSEKENGTIGESNRGGVVEASTKENLLNLSPTISLEDSLGNYTLQSDDPQVDCSNDISLDVTPELINLQMKLEANIRQAKEDEELARRLQREEETRSPSVKRPRVVGPRQTTLDETFFSAKKRKQD